MSQQYPQQPGYAAPPPKKRSTGKIIGLGCAGVFALFIIIGTFGAALSGGSDDSSSKGSAASSSAPAKDDSNSEDTAAGTEKEGAPSEPAEAAPVKVTAKKTAFAKSIIADGSNYTSVLVTVANNGDEEIDVNPLYFTITDSGGTKHTHELAADENQIDTVKLAPGENVSGTVTGSGKFTAEYVTYTDGLIGDSMRADVS